MLTRCTERDQHKRLAPRVDELVAELRRDAAQAIDGDPMLDALHAQRQLSREHEVDLFLTSVRVDATALARSKHDQVDSERLDAQFATERLEAFPVLSIERRERR